MSHFQQPEYRAVRIPDGRSSDEPAKRSGEALSESWNRDTFQQEKTRYRIRTGFVLRKIAGAYAIVPVAVGSGSPLENTVMAPNDSAVFIWKCFEQPSTLEDVVAKGVLEYDVAEEKLRKSVENFAADALRYGILEEVK